MRRSLALVSVFVACGRDDDRTAILPLSELDTSPACARAFRPEKEDLAKFEAKLPSALEPSLAARAPRYWRQYIGWKDCVGVRWIHGNFFCEVWEPEHFWQRNRWRRSYQQVNDGGDCYFSIEYSPDTDATRELRINGEA